MINTFWEHFSKRPSMYLGLPSLSSLAAFIAGIQITETIHKIPSEKSLFPRDLDQFEDWLSEKDERYNRSTKSYGLAEQLAKERPTADFDKEAFYTWMDWYKDFAEETVRGKNDSSS